MYLCLCGFLFCGVCFFVLLLFYLISYVTIGVSCYVSALVSYTMILLLVYVSIVAVTMIFSCSPFNISLLPVFVLMMWVVDVLCAWCMCLDLVLFVYINLYLVVFFSAVMCQCTLSNLLYIKSLR